MKLFAEQHFTYPGFIPGDWGWCDVDVFRHPANPHLLVVLRDQDDQQRAEPADHVSTSVTNALESVCHAVYERLLEPNGLAGLEAFWIHWSRSDQVASSVYFLDRANFALPEWDYLSPEEFGRLLAAFGGEGQLEAWLAEGGLAFEGFAPRPRKLN